MPVLDAFFRNHPEPMWVYDLESLSFLAVNHAAITHYGYSEAEFLRMTIADIRPKEDIRNLMENIAKVAGGRDEAGIWRHVKKSGELIHVRITSYETIYEGRRAEIVSATDVSDLVRAKMRLQDQDAALRTAQSLLKVGPWKIDCETRRISWPDDIESITGMRAEDIPQDFDAFIPLLHPDDRSREVTAFENFLNSDNDQYEFQYRIIGPDGEIIHLRGKGQVVETANGRALTGIIQNVTEMVEQSSQMWLLSECMSRVNDIILITEAGPIDDPDGPRIVFVNEAFERKTGYSIEEAIGKTPRFLQGAETQRTELDRIRNAIAARQPVQAQLINYTKQGTPLWLEVDIVPVAIGGGEFTHFIAIERDITERKGLENRLRESERLESLGQLTGGIAHDFNNLLTVVLGNSESLYNRLPDGPLREMASLSLAASRRGSDLVMRLLAFARRQALAPAPANLNEWLEDNLPLLRHSLPESISIDLDLHPDIGIAAVDRSQFDTALLNLCLNAKDAMANGGQLHIQTKNVDVDDSFAETMPEIEPGAYVMVAVRDNGSGMAPEVRDRAFEPFFTTKNAGVGSGLGLSMVYGFVRQSGGDVAIHSDPGQGTTVRLFFPQSADRTAKVVKPARRERAALPELKVLVVEDNEFVMAHVKRLMNDLGMKVVAAANGPEALEQLSRHPDISLLFTDVVLPGGMDGVQISEAVRAVRPEVRTIYTTGYTENATILSEKVDDKILLLGKPYRKQDLVEKIWAALERRPA
ncbi:PAS domain S-box protein [Henriciella pelagia]|uniref:PAS domain S-box protein n=1 Tax=Henriciella pelagia TaxID=1977912 RepID=UPI0035120C3D